MEPTSILICDDHGHFRDGPRALLETSSEVEVVGEAPDGRRRWKPRWRCSPTWC